MRSSCVSAMVCLRRADGVGWHVAGRTAQEPCVRGWRGARLARPRRTARARLARLDGGALIIAIAAFAAELFKVRQTRADVGGQATHSAARDWALGGSAAHRCGTWHCSAGQPAGTGRDWALKCPHLVRDWHSSAFDHTGT